MINTYAYFIGSVAAEAKAAALTAAEALAEAAAAAAALQAESLTQAAAEEAAAEVAASVEEAVKAVAEGAAEAAEAVAQAVAAEAAAAASEVAAPGAPAPAPKPARMPAPEPVLKKPAPAPKPAPRAPAPAPSQERLTLNGVKCGGGGNATATTEGEAAAAKARGQMRTVRDLHEMKIRDLKALILEAGLDVGNCLDKSELVALAEVAQRHLLSCGGSQKTNAKNGAAAGRSRRLTLADLSEDHRTLLPQGQVVSSKWAYCVELFVTLGGQNSVRRLKNFPMHVYTKDGQRHTLGGMSKDSTVNDMCIAASAVIGVPVRAIANQGRVLSENLTVADLMFGETIAENLCVLVGEKHQEEHQDEKKDAEGLRQDELGLQHRFTRCARLVFTTKMRLLNTSLFCDLGQARYTGRRQCSGSRFSAAFICSAVFVSNRNKQHEARHQASCG